MLHIAMGVRNILAAQNFKMWATLVSHKGDAPKLNEGTLH